MEKVQPLQQMTQGIINIRILKNAQPVPCTILKKNVQNVNVN